MKKRTQFRDCPTCKEDRSIKIEIEIKEEHVDVFISKCVFCETKHTLDNDSNLIPYNPTDKPTNN